MAHSMAQAAPQANTQTPTNGPRFWLVGASSGIGLALCERLLAAHFCVVATARDATGNEALRQLQGRYPSQLALVDMDVSAPYAQIASQVYQAWQCFSGLDIWFYNVGVYHLADFSQSDYSAFVEMTQANYLGCVAIWHALRDQRIQAGQSTQPMRWIWNLSIANQVGLPYGGGYSAPKAALLNLAEAMRPELPLHQVHLQVINHGFVKTRLTAKNPFKMPALMTVDEASEAIMAMIGPAHALTAERHFRPPVRFWQRWNPLNLLACDFETHFPKRLTLFLKWMRLLPYAWQLALTRLIVNKK